MLSAEIHVSVKVKVAVHDIACDRVNYAHEHA